MAEAEVTLEQLEEYEKELANVKELLEASPEDESLLTLKTDLEQLVALTKETLSGGAASYETPSEPAAASESKSEESSSVPPSDLPLPPPPPPPAVAAAEAKTTATTTAAKTSSEPPKKKLKKMKDFEVPERLVPLDTDSEAEKKRKRRAIKALKSQWRAQKKELETESKKQSWQSFQKKKGKKKDGSIFSTHDGDAKIGVVAARKKTEFGGRQRHK